MDMAKISEASGKILIFLDTLNIKPDEKIAALDTAAWTIRSVLSSEMLRLTWAQILDKAK
uniref:Uncharacterized protein n=1 Tax=viral metagenome TaxID=1070528 RepID=A0A6M3JTW9_9ZZZZ